jgi:hypothetical protein
MSRGSLLHSKPELTDMLVAVAQKPGILASRLLLGPEVAEAAGVAVCHLGVLL